METETPVVGQRRLKLSVLATLLVTALAACAVTDPSGGPAATSDTPAAVAAPAEPGAEAQFELVMGMENTPNGAFALCTVFWSTDDAAQPTVDFTITGPDGSRFGPTTHGLATYADDYAHVTCSAEGAAHTGEYQLSVTEPGASEVLFTAAGTLNSIEPMALPSVELQPAAEQLTISWLPDPAARLSRLLVIEPPGVTPPIYTSEHEHVFDTAGIPAGSYRLLLTNYSSDLRLAQRQSTPTSYSSATVMIEFTLD